MKIVIDIPTEHYNEIVYENIDKLREVIKNGTPLPKGHGRLGDLDSLEQYFRVVRKKLNKDDYKTAIEYFTRDNMLLNTEQFIHLEPTIIPADVEEVKE